jgi:hypothetical protein
MGVSFYKALYCDIYYRASEMIPQLWIHLKEYCGMSAESQNCETSRDRLC